MMLSLRLTSNTPQETENLGNQLGRLLSAGSFVALRGNLGCGKTCFTRGLVLSTAVESSGLVASPTYAIMNNYPGSPPVYHFDFYRLSGDDEIIELGFEEFFYGDGICVVEWSERLTKLLPLDRLIVEFEHRGDDQRSITISAQGIKCVHILNCLKELFQINKKVFDL
jgi:tRNA threonylcarbamoyladenosine biosynthesis protein TsaE